jgi:hypothetical protein
MSTLFFRNFHPLVEMKYGERENDFLVNLFEENSIFYLSGAQFRLQAFFLSTIKT